jgi:hypothetical protein
VAARLHAAERALADPDAEVRDRAINYGLVVTAVKGSDPCASIR